MSKYQQRSDLSVKNKYWIPKLRYLELKNFCLQYPEWKAALASIDPIKAHLTVSQSTNITDLTHEYALRRMRLEENINLIKECTLLADESIASWLLKGVTENYSYNYLKYQLDLPAGRDYYYDRYRKFFWILDRKRN